MPESPAYCTMVSVPYFMKESWASQRMGWRNSKYLFVNDSWQGLKLSSERPSKPRMRLHRAQAGTERATLPARYTDA